MITEEMHTFNIKTYVSALNNTPILFLTIKYNRPKETKCVNERPKANPLVPIKFIRIMSKTIFRKSKIIKWKNGVFVS